MKPQHHALVIASPWQGVYATHIDSARHFSKHWHSTHGIGLLEAGAQRSASGRGSVEAFAGDLITSNPGEVHDGRPLGARTRRWRMVYFEPGVIASMTERHGCDVELEQPVLRDARVAQAFRQLLDHIEAWSRRVATNPAATAADMQALACEEAMVNACSLLLCRRMPPAMDAQANHPALAQVRDCLGDDPLQAPTLATLAAMAGLSKYQLLRRFADAYGITPHAWLLQRRAEHARRFIQRGDALVMAAASAGFADQSHMTRVFTRQFGFTPGAWRAAAVPQPTKHLQ